MMDSNKYQAQANELSQKLWAIANDLRGNMDASKFKNIFWVRFSIAICLKEQKCIWNRYLRMMI